jgi:two-component system LytT family response regulator
VNIRALIVDDEPLARRRLRQLLREAGDVEVVGECGNGADAIDAIRATAPDLVFLDIQMPAPDGFGVVEAIGPERMPIVIFVTAYDRYALRAFDAQALDYLLKPFDRERFTRTLTRARAAVAQARPAALTAQLIAWLQAHQRDVGAGPTSEPASAPAFAPASGPGSAAVAAPAPAVAPDHLVSRSTGRLALVRTADIDWISADSNYACLHVGRESHLVRESLATLAVRLAPARFRRIHRSTIVNLDRVKELQPGFRGDYVVVLRDGTRLTLSRSHRRELPELFGPEEE